MNKRERKAKSTHKSTATSDNNNRPMTNDDDCIIKYLILCLLAGVICTLAL